MYNGEWSGYERALFLHLENQNQESRKRLKKELAHAARKKRPLPGLSAEYAYLLYLEGDKKTALQYFKQEKRFWPQSKEMMDFFIARIEQDKDIAQ